MRRRNPKQDRRSIERRLAMCKIGIRSLAKIDGFMVVRLELAPLREDAAEGPRDARGGHRGASRSVGTGKASK